MKRLGRLLTAMVTPFNEEGEVDYEQAKKLALALLNSGSEGLVVAGYNWRIADPYLGGGDAPVCRGEIGSRQTGNSNCLAPAAIAPLRRSRRPRERRKSGLMPAYWSSPTITNLPRKAYTSTSRLSLKGPACPASFIMCRHAPLPASPPILLSN